MQFTKEQQKAITDMRPLVCVAAGAGSGKTTILIERIAHLLNTPALWPDDVPQLDRIAAITFTDKAAAEMKARLRRKFRECAAQDRAETMRFWREMERQVDTARITTIHSFCASLLREHALRFGMDPDWGVLTDADAAQLAEQAVDTTLLTLLENEDPAAENLSLCFSLASLKQALSTTLAARWKYQGPEMDTRYESPEQLRAYWQEAAPEALRMLTETFRRSYVVLKHVEALESFEGGCSDPNDKREQNRVAFIELLQAIYEGERGTPEKAASVLKQFERLAGSKKNWDESDYAEVGDAIKDARDFIKQACAMPAENAAFEERVAKVTCDFYHVSKQVMAAYAQMRAERAAVDFDDMINETLLLLRENADLRKRVAHSLRFLLIDEFQDTDERQLEVARLLTDVKGGPDLFIVGDVKQSIYLFRGAEVSLFKKVREEDPKAIALSVNYRSLPDVMCFVNNFFQQSELLSAVEDYVPMDVSRPAASAPRVELFAPEPENEAKAEYADETTQREATFVARRIREICDGPTPLQLTDGKDGAERAATYDDVVLLFRTGRHIPAYEAALRDAQIPYNRIAGEGFFNRREIEDMLALLTLIQDPWDEESLVTVLRSPLIALSDESLMRMAETGEGLAATFHGDVVPEQFDDTDVLTWARQLFKQLHAAREMAPGELLRKVFVETGIEAVLLSQHLGLQRVSNLRKLLQIADSFGHGRAGTLAEFTHYLEEVRVREIREGEAMLQCKGMGAVTLMTIHKSKGLEFPVVFLPQLWNKSNSATRDLTVRHNPFGFVVKTPDDEGKPAHGVMGELLKRLQKEDDAAEAARILYVAMTRARDYLVLCGHAHPKKNSWAAMLNEVYDLECRAHEAVLSGDGWQAVLKRNVPDTPPPRTAGTTPVTLDRETIVRAIRPVEVSDAVGDVISVSRLIALMAQDNIEDTDIEPAPKADISNTETIHADRDYAMTRGTLVHRLFELWDFKNDTLPDMEMLLDEANLGLQARERLKNDLCRVADLLRTSMHRALFAGAAAIRRETPFLLAVGDVLVRGVIDAVLDDTVIVDYKTGKPDPERMRHYTDQLLVYAAALRDINGQAPDSALLWFADYGEARTVAVTNEAIDATLSRARTALGQ